MKKVLLSKTGKEARIGDRVEDMPANVFEDCLLIEDNEPVGVYISDVTKYSTKLKKLMDVANAEFRSDSVPKQLLERSDVFQAVYTGGKTRAQAKKEQTVQYSTIIGSIAAKPHMRRPYHNKSSVHAVKSASTFIKAMRLASNECSEIFKQFMPQQYALQKAEIEKVDPKWRLGDIFTSSISNYNIAAPIHIDNANIKNSWNMIYTKRNNSRGGCLYVPDYDAVFEQPNDSLLIYPAWRNRHGVTPIVETMDNGYRNSLVFYALKAFVDG